MADSLTIDLGEVKFAYKPKYLEPPKLRATFEMPIDTGFVDSDALLKQALGKVAPKMIGDEMKKRAAMIDKALADVDKDIDKKYKDHLKKEGIDPKKGLLPAQKQAHDAFLNQISKLAENLQAYLEKIVDGINKVDAQKWMIEAYNKCYPAVEKVMEKKASDGNKRALKRAAGGRAKIIILAIVAIAVTALIIAGTILTGGALLAAIFAIAGASLAAIAIGGKAVINLAKTRDKLRQSVAKLKSEAEEIKAAVDSASKVPTSKTIDDGMLKKYGLNVKDYKQQTGEDKINPDLLYKALAGKKRLFSQFESHLKDVTALATQIQAGIMASEKAVLESQAKVGKMAKDLMAAKDQGVPPTELKKMLDNIQKAENSLIMAQRSIEAKKADLKNLNDLIVDCRGYKGNYEKLGVVKSKLSGSMIKMSQVETAFGDLETIGSQLNTASTYTGYVQANQGDKWYMGMKGK